MSLQKKDGGKMRENQRKTELDCLEMGEILRHLRELLPPAAHCEIHPTQIS